MADRHPACSASQQIRGFAAGEVREGTATSDCTHTQQHHGLLKAHTQPPMYVHPPTGVSVTCMPFWHFDTQEFMTLNSLKFHILICSMVLLLSAKELKQFQSSPLSVYAHGLQQLAALHSTDCNSRMCTPRECSRDIGFNSS